MNALALRRNSLDLVPEGAYWREPTRVEAKVDWQRVEAEEGDALETARIAIALALTIQMEDVIEQVTDQRFRIRSSTLRVDTADVETAFVRLSLQGYVDGQLQLHNSLRRSIVGYKMPDTVGLTAAGTQDMIELASRMGRKFALGILDGIQLVLDSAMIDGKDTTQIVAEIRSRYAQFIELKEAPQGRLEAARVKPKGETPKVATRRRGRRMKVRDREQYQQWQNQYLPFSKRMRQTMDGYLAEARIPRLAKKQASDWLLTEYTRAVNHGITQGALADPDVVQITYTSMRDGKVCPVCDSLDGVTRAKDDQFWGQATPPMHPKCRCYKVAVTRQDRVPVTPKKDLPDLDSVSPGWGGYDPNRVRTMRKLGKAIK